jgi:hypothetical protein
MRVICPHCYSKALITSTYQHTVSVKDLYCCCTNTRGCGASFKCTLAYMYDLNPPQKTTLDIAKTLIKNLQPDQRKQLQGDLFS